MAITRRAFLRSTGLTLAVSTALALDEVRAAAVVPKAGLFLVGGPSVDHALEGETYRELMRRSRKGTGATISFVTSASSIFRRKRMEEHLSAFVRMGAEASNIHIVSLMKQDDSAEVIRDTPFAVRPDDRRALADALRFLQTDDVVFMDGGDQKRLVAILKSVRLDDGNPCVWDLIAKRYRDDPSFLLGGTSAGASALPRRMIHEDTVTKPEKDQYWGFNLPGLERIAIDTHYDKRGRIWRFPAFMRKTGDILGLGLPENGGLSIRDGIAEVFSTGAPDREVAVQLNHPDGEAERRFCPGQRFALAELLSRAEKPRAFAI
jgi:cyanophycinase